MIYACTLQKKSIIKKALKIIPLYLHNPPFWTPADGCYSKSYYRRTNKSEKRRSKRGNGNKQFIYMWRNFICEFTQSA